MTLKKLEIARITIDMVKDYFGLHHTKIKIVPTYEVGDEYNAFINPISDWEYEIELHPFFLRTCQEEDLVKVVAHEMTHVKQYVYEDLDLETGGCYWKGEFFDEDVEGYWFTPWEIEARGYEQAFWALYVDKWENYV
jgi:hypothetical protein